MPADDEPTPVPETELDWSYARAGGPGGQNVNKVSSKAILRWNMTASDAVNTYVKTRVTKLFPSRVTDEGDVLIMSQEFRDQERNRQACLEKLSEMLRVAKIIEKPRVKTKPSKGSKQRRLTAKKIASQRKEQRKVDHD
ncbi:alternative ribosome rescue aminoacyl-tRNA hydrolase ArfB [soil metagenome]